MAACPRCGAQNADTNAFCTGCGGQLSVSAPPGFTPAPLPSPTPAPPAPPSFSPGQGPFLPPSPQTVSPHRLSHAAIVAIAVIAVLIVGGGGLAFVALHGSAKSPTPLPIGQGSAPSQQPTLSPQPTSTPQPSPPNPGPSGAGSTVRTAFATVFVPSGFSVADQDSTSIALAAADGNGVVTISVVTGNFATNDDLRQALLNSDQQDVDSNAAFCNSNVSSAALTGDGGVIPAEVFAVCENLTPQSGPAFAAVDGYVAGVASTSNGTEGCVIEVLGPKSTYSQFADEVPDSIFNKTVFTGAGPGAASPSS